MAHYETMYIVHPALEAGRLKDLIISVESTLKELGGTTHTIETWGKKKLAYPINKEKYGMYVLFQFEADGSKNKELNLTLDHNTNILAYLTTKIDQEQLLSNDSSLDSQLGLLNKNETKDNSSTSSNITEEKSTEDSNETTDNNDVDNAESDDSKEEN
jgi:small subunit ribosomal protein S6